MLTIMVKDLDKTIVFYQAFGFSLDQRWSDHFAQVSAPGIRIGLHPGKEKAQGKANGNLSIGFTTESMEEAGRILDSLGIGYETREEEGGNFIHFSDPDGTALYFIKPKW